MADVDITKLMPLLVSMRAMCDALLMEIAKKQEPKTNSKPNVPHVHEVEPGFGATGVCQICGEIVTREVKND
jgi:hypothetical protein